VKVNRLVPFLLIAVPLAAQSRPRARDIGILAGSIPTGPLNAITDVAGVRVGHTDLRIQGVPIDIKVGAQHAAPLPQNGDGSIIMVVATATLEVVVNDWMSPLFQATADATEEAIYNSLLRAETVRGYRGVVPALPIDSTVMILKRHGAIPR